jgi:Tol biopolymer transport system component
LLLLAAAAAATVVALPGAASHAAPRFQSPYACGYCLFEVPLGGGPMRILLGDPPLTLIDDLSPTRRQLLLSRPEPVEAEIGLYVASLDGSADRRVAHGSRGRWSADGTKIVYYHPTPVTAESMPCGLGLWVVDPDGTSDHQFTQWCALGVAWSPDSRRLAFFAAPDPRAKFGTLVTDSVNGGDARILGDGQVPGQPEWAPSGDRLAYSALPDADPPTGHGVSSGGSRDEATAVLRLVGAEGALLARLPQAAEPVWAPSGDEFAFEHVDAARRTGYEVFDRRGSLRVASAEGRTVRTLREDCCRGAVRWLPDGRSIAFVDTGTSPSPRRGEDADQIFVIGREGAPVRQVSHFLPGGRINAYWVAPDASVLYVVWEFVGVD